MTDVLILGGTGWLSGAIAERWVSSGARVTCLARGGRPAPAGAELVVADRGDPGGYSAISRREWDEVVDITSDAGHAASAVGALADAATHWTFVSTVSVYAENDTAGADESAALLEPLRPGDADDYGRAKVAAEAVVRETIGQRAAIVRPGLIVGPGDPTDRFGYWVARFALAGAGPVLVPPTEGVGVQVIDVRDLARFVVGTGANRWNGTVNAVGLPQTLDAVLAAAADVAGFTGTRITAPEGWLREHDVAYWAGPSSLPLWLPPDMPGFARRSNARYSARGGRHRPIRETLADVLVDERRRGLDRQRRSGLSRPEEERLLAELR